MNKTAVIFILIITLSHHLIYPQQLDQTIKGRVYDNEILAGLPGATVIIPGSDPLMGTTTDHEGYFVLEKVRVGRCNLKVSFIGYEDNYVSGILINSGKEIFLEIPLKEKMNKLDEVVIRPDYKKEKALNKMATLSARTFSVEDAQRYAGGMDDPSRLAGSFAGVTPNTIDNNEIVIRGNAAKGILWRLEGAEIPAPNHLAGLFSGGGVNTMFNNNMLANSDFMTGAFPAEYGNALSGVFDINFRQGNSDEREYAFQAGTYGIDFSAEGPFVKGKRSSYLINYRYSTYGLLQNLLPQVTEMPSYSDLAVKLVLPSEKIGTFSLWSINGTGNIRYKNDGDTANWETNYDSYEYDIKYSLTATGLNHRKIIGNRSYIFSSLAFSATGYLNCNAYFRKNLLKVPVTEQDEKNYRINFQSYINNKFNSRHANRTGFSISRLSYNYDVSANTEIAYSDTNDFFVKSKDYSFSYQLFSQSKFYITERLNVNAGIHILYYRLNQEIIFEPRMGINWKMSEYLSLNMAYGKHSKPEPLRIYLMDINIDDQLVKANSDLNITKAHHFVMGFDIRIASNTHLIIEPYYQRLFDVPVIPDSSFSMINYSNEMFFSDILLNSGTGFNTGIDLTLERFMSNGFYYMVTGSLYKSKFTGDDKVLRHTRYNQNFVINLLGGKEWQIRNTNTISLNGKFTFLGGKRHSPVDYQESIKNQFVIYDHSNLYEKQSPANYYIDLSLNYTINKPKYSQVIILQIKNLLLQKEFLGHTYNYKNNTVEPYYLMLMFPYLSYKIQF